MCETKLACGGKGPCCHIGYSHRHCEHCDMVVDTRPANWWLAPYVAPYLPYVRPPYQYLTNTTDHTTLGGTANASGFVQALSRGADSISIDTHNCETQT